MNVERTIYSILLMVLYMIPQYQISRQLADFADRLEWLEVRAGKQKKDERGQ